MITLRIRWTFGAAAALAALAALAAGRDVRAQAAAASNPLASLHWRFIGPNGNRTAAIAGEPGHPLVDYVGAASGGIWKTENGGVSWKPIFDHEQVSAIGALAVSESEPHTVWAGTGETFLIRPFYPMGDGVYKSTDAGDHWQHMGLEETGHVGRIVIDPTDAKRVFVCALGQLFKPQPERGVYRTVDGGKTWQQVLKIDEKTGCSDLAMDPRDPNTLYAGMWPLLIHPWNLDGGGPTGGVYITHDGGATWHKAVGHGMPAADHPVGKVAVAVARSLPRRVYALVQDTQPTLYRSDDGGNSWTMVSHSHLMVQRDSYYVRFGVSPTDADRLYFLSPNYVISLDAGKTFVRPNTDGFASAGGDNHDMWIDPTNANRIMVANDAGASISLDGSRTFEQIRLPIAQVYHVTTDDQIPYNIYGNVQDGNSFRGPSNNLQTGGFGGGGIRAADFQSVGGCESGFATPDPADNDVVWSGCYEGVISRINLRDGQARDVSVWPDVADGWAPKDVKYRWHWTIPLEISPFDSKRVYVGSQFVHETSDGGQTWKVISPDLTLNDKSHQGDSGGITFDNLYTYDGDVIYSIAESPKKAGLIWVGTNDGQVSLTEDGGAHWTNVTKQIPNLPPFGTIWNIEPSPFDAGTAYITANLEQMGDYNAYVYKTADYGKSWQFISGGVPKGFNSSAHCVIEDPVRKGMLYLGTDNAVYVSWDDGGHWTSLSNNLPPAPVYWLTIQKRFNDLVISTYGRGDYILDDVTALREYDKAKSANAAYLFTPRPAYRFRSIGNGRMSEPGSRIVGQNPPYGADINFYLPAADPKVTLSVAGPDGKIVRTLSEHGQAGINRVWWDLRGENGKMPRMLVPPVGADWMQNGPEGYHILRGIMIPNEVRGPLMVPGTYTVHLTAGGKTLSEPLTVLADPHSLGTPATLKAEEAFETQVIGEIDQVSDMIEHLEWVRQQVATLHKRYATDPSLKATLDEAAKLAERATAIEGKLIDVYLTDGHEDLNRHPSQLYQKLTALYDKNQADQGPTAADLEVNRFFREWMDKSKAELDQFATDVSAVNEALRARHVSMTIQP
ncbi:MAG: VPS10 domain-containing protein [Betaproteobacteria bacterium]